MMDRPADELEEDLVGTVNLLELAELMDTSANTLRRMIREHADFPVAARGSHGRPYAFDPVAVAEHLKRHEAELETARVERQAELAQMRLDLFGGETIDEPALALSARDRAASLEVELRATNLAAARGELVRKAEVEAALASAMTRMRQDLLQVASEIARRFDLDRDKRLAVEDLVALALNRCVDGARAELRGDYARAA